jgi:RimJ/RimL family protein N-acetyltransferase
MMESAWIEESRVARLMSVEIRSAHVEDMDGVWRCVDVVARERAYLSFLEGPPPEDSRKFWRDLIEKSFPFEIAVDQGDVVGWCDIAPVPRPVFSHIGSLGMGLLPAYRGAGIGRRLLVAALAQARGRGIERVELHVFSDNVRARHLYESLGFIVEGIHPRRIKIDGQYRDDVAMALVFASAG